MSRLRRREIHSRFFFVTANLLRRQPPFNAREYSVLAIGLNRTRERLPFALCGYCFMPDHIYAIIFPRGDDDHLGRDQEFQTHNPSVAQAVR